MQFTPRTLDPATGTEALAATATDKSLTPDSGWELVSNHRGMKPSTMWKTPQLWDRRKPLRVLMFGDSYADRGVPFRQMWGRFGYGGMFDYAAAVYTGGAALASDNTIYPGQGYSTIPSAATATWNGTNASGQIQATPGSILKIYYVARSGGGTFKVQTEVNLSGSWSDVAGYTSVSTDNSGTAIPVLLAITVSAAFYRIRIVGVSGTSWVIFCNPEEQDNSATGGNKMGGMSYMRFDQGSTSPVEWLVSSQANWNVMLKDINVVAISSLETAAVWAQYLPTLMARFAEACPYADIIFVGGHPTNVAANPLSYDDADVYLQQYCADNNRLFVDVRRYCPPWVLSTTSTLTSNNTNVSDGDIVTIGPKAYVFRTVLTSPFVEGEVLIGASADASLLNLSRAANHLGTAGTDYSSFAKHMAVTAATSVTAHAIAFTGLVQQAIPVSTTAATLNWSVANIVGGTFYDTGVHTVGYGTQFIQKLVWDCLQPLVDMDVSTLTTTQLAHPVGPWSGGYTANFLVVNPAGETSSTKIIFASAKGNVTNYTGKSLGAFSPVEGGAVGDMAFRQAKDGQYMFIGADTAGRHLFGSLGYTGSSITVGPNAGVEALGSGSTQPCLIAGVISGQTANALEVRTGRSISAAGTAVAGFGPTGKLLALGVTFTLVAGSATVSDTNVTANSVIIVTLKTAGGTRAGLPDIVPTASTGFVATAVGTDTSTYNYVIIN